MKKSRKKSRKGSGKCPIHFALEVFGDKWSLLIIRDIVFKGKSCYGEFLHSPEGVSTNILANRLAKLEANEILTKTRDPENLAKFQYDLTQKGLDLIPVLLAMTEWSAKYDFHPNNGRNIIHGAPEDLLERNKLDHDAIVAELSENIRARKEN